MTRRSLAGAILAVWAISLAWLGIREYRTPSVDLLDEATRRVPPGATFAGVWTGDRQIGYASTTVDTVPDGLTIDDRIVLEIPVPGSVTRTQSRTVIELSNALRLRSFEAAFSSPTSRFDAVGSVTGDSLLTVELRRADVAVQTIRMPLTGRPVILPVYLPLELAFRDGLLAGAEYVYETFDPLTLATEEVALEVRSDSTLFVPDSAAYDSALGAWYPVRWDTVHAWRVRERRGDRVSMAWIDDLGRLVSTEEDLGYRVERSAFELVFNNFEPDTTRGIGASPVRREGPVAAGVTSLPPSGEQLVFRIHRVPSDGLELDGGRQRLDGNTVTITRESVDPTAPYRLPADSSRFAPLLRPDALIHSDDPRVGAQARQIVGRTRNPVRAAQALVTWVGDNMERRVDPGPPAAVGVLDARAGDSSDLTQLFVSMARAVGLPARSVSGLLYIRGTFYYHSWSEVFLNDWVAVDPTFGQFPADAAHLRLTTGGLARQLELIRLTGQLDIDPLD